MELTFKTKNEKQLIAAESWIDSVTEQILYGGAKGGGKSYLGATLIFGDALIYPDTAYFIARKELIDLTSHTIPTIHEVFKNWGLRFDDYAKYNGQNHTFHLHNGSRVLLIACRENPSDPFYESFGSMQMTRGWIEEGGEVPENAKANLWLSIGRWNNDTYGLKKKLLITANPKKGWMKRDFVDPFKKNELEISKKYIQAFPTDNPYLSKDYIKTLSDEKNKVRRQRLWEGNWDYDEDADSLISLDALTDTFSNTIVKDGQKYLIVDVARKGVDRTVFSFWDGLELYKIEERTKQSTEMTEQQARDFASAEKIPYSHILIDEDGIGGGVVDHLLGVKGFVANSSPFPTGAEIRTKHFKVQNGFIPKANFRNLKSQCGWKLAELINEHKLAVKVLDYRDIIVEEVTALLRNKAPDSDGKLQLIPKEEVKEQLGRSPDIGDTLLMRMWFELKKDALEEDPIKQEKITRQIQDQFSVNLKRQSLNSTK